MTKLSPPTEFDRNLLLLTAICAVTFFTNLGGAKLWDRDEPRNARCAVEMKERGDWVVPTFNGELRTHKPILLYWLMLTAYSMFGETEFAARFWSAALSMGTVWLTYSIGRSMFNRQAGFWASVVLATSLMFNVAARAATPDAVLIFCCTLALSLLWHAHQKRSDGQHQRGRLLELGAFAAMGLAVLAKGPVGVVLPTAAWYLFLVWDVLGSGRLRFEARVFADLFRQARPFALLTVVGIVAVPWYFLVGLRTDGLWLNEFFFVHNLERATSSMEGHHGNPLLFYPVAILAGFFPWSIFAIPALIWTWLRLRDKSVEYRFLLSWIVCFVIPFSLASTKLPNYVTPTYPALALITGHFLTRWSAAARRKTARCWRRNGRLTAWPRTIRSSGIPIDTPASSRGAEAPAINWTLWSSASLTIVGLVMTIGVGVGTSKILPGETTLSSIGLIPLFGGLLSLCCFRLTHWDAGMKTIAVTATLFSVALFAVGAPRVSRHQTFAELIRTSDLESRPLASLGVHEPSWIFYANRVIPFFPADNTAKATDFLHTNGGHLITSQRQYDALNDELPTDLTVVARVPYFLKDDHLLLIRR